MPKIRAMLIVNQIKYKNIYNVYYVQHDFMIDMGLEKFILKRVGRQSKMLKTTDNNIIYI